MIGFMFLKLFNIFIKYNTLRNDASIVLPI